ncbi:MAG: LamG-like jellyroll fold domain-containing protein [Planctomycetota bacterium]
MQRRKAFSILQTRTTKKTGTSSNKLMTTLFSLFLFFSAGVAYGDSVDLEDGLVSYWSFNEGVGSVAHDEGGNGNDGDIYGSPSWVDGISGKCLHFDGVDDYVNIPDVEDFYFADQSLTFLAWVTIHDNLNEYRNFISLGDGNGDNRPSINLVKSRSGYWQGRAYFESYDKSNWIGAAKSDEVGSELADGEWRLLCGIYDWDSKTIKLYINGVLQSSQGTLQSFDMNDASQLSLRIGCWCGSDPTTEFHCGEIDEVRIYNRALNEDEITYLFNATPGSTIYVDDDNVAGPWDGTQDHPYLTIQDGIDNALHGHTVLVMPGIYIENIDFKGKSIIVRSAEGNENTVIDGNESGSVVTFKSHEGHDSVLEGFTLQNGSGTDINPSGTARYCGGGVICRGEVAPVIRNNRITANHVDSDGGGILCTSSTLPIRIENNMVYKNSCNNGGEGGGIGLWECDDVKIVNCTIFGNDTDCNAGGLLVASSSVSVVNTIMWNNTASAGKGDEIYLYNPSGQDPILSISFSMVKGGVDGVIVDAGTLNWNTMMINDAIEKDPMFADQVNDDFHLTCFSPCINRGTGAEAPSDDFEGGVRPIMGIMDIGADEYTSIHVLAADAFHLSVAAGGTIHFTFDGLPENGGRGYCLTGTFSETLPGTPLPGDFMLRANWDFFNDLILFPLINTAWFDRFQGVLDAQGQGTAELNLPAGLDPVLVDLTMYFALTSYAPFAMVSNPVPLTFVQ